METKKASRPQWWLVVVVALMITLSGCRGLVASNPPTNNPPPPPPPPQDLTLVNHIIFMAQENRGFDHYFGAMRKYWAANNITDQSFDGLPQFNPTSGAAPLQGPVASNPGCDPLFPPPNNCTIDSNSPTVTSLHMISTCEENPSPFWNEAHVDFNQAAPLSGTAKLDGFVKTAAHDARTTTPPFNDTNGLRAMSYYDGGDLNYYYFMASNFSTSDRWFSPVMTRTQPNRMYMLAGTSAGHVSQLMPGQPLLTIPTIFDLLQAAGVSWKVYVTDLTYATPARQDSAINFFTTSRKYPQNIVPVSEFFTDVQNGTLPSVAYIEPGLDSGLDEHPGLDDNIPGGSVRRGARYVSTLINALMQSPSWKDSAFIWTVDEHGGFYDHVPPQPTVSPDGIKPLDLTPNAICATPQTGPTCDFVYTGYRVPMFVVSPFAKKNYVSHTVADYTAWLRLVESRFRLPGLTQRDAAQVDSSGQPMMLEFFDFVNVPWKTPPNPPAQVTGGSCYMNTLP